MMACLGEIRELEKTLTSPDHISENIVNQDMKFLQEVSQDFSFVLYKFQPLNLCRKKFIAKIRRSPVWSSETLESKALIQNVMKPTPKIEEKRDQRLRNQPLRGANLQ